MPCPIASVEEFYAHALAIEREAAARYGEFAEWFADRGEDVLSNLCRNLAGLESKHHDELLQACAGLTLPPVDETVYHWLASGPPETEAREVFYRVSHPRHLLEIALAGELRARGFFVWIATEGSPAQVRELASIMAAEETEHVRWVREALDYHPKSPEWEALFARGTGPGDSPAR